MTVPLGRPAQCARRATPVTSASSPVRIVVRNAHRAPMIVHTSDVTNASTVATSVAVTAAREVSRRHTEVSGTSAATAATAVGRDPQDSDRHTPESVVHATSTAVVTAQPSVATGAPHVRW